MHGETLKFVYGVGFKLWLKPREVQKMLS